MPAKILHQISSIIELRFSQMIQVIQVIQMIAYKICITNAQNSLNPFRHMLFFFGTFEDFGLRFWESSPAQQFGKCCKHRKCVTNVTFEM